MRSPSKTAQTDTARVLESGLTAFSATEVHVAVVPVGEIPSGVLESYYTLISKHRQVELQSVQPFYTAQQKSPFKAFPWKQGCMHFKFLPEETSLKPNPLTALHTSRKILGVIGVCHCPTNSSLSKAYKQFENVAKQFPNAVTLRCFAFQPTNEQVTAENQNKEKKANLMMFPPTDAEGLDQLENHASFLMLDFAAFLLGELERWMLTASPAMVDLNTFADTSDKFLGPSSLLTDMQKRFPAAADEEVTRKRRYGRLQKAMGDYSLLAGSPVDAADHYNTAAELSRMSNDHIWCAAALIGMANAKVMEQCLVSGAMKGTSKGDNGEAVAFNPSKRMATLRAASQVSAASNGLGGQQFWELLRESSLEQNARNFYMEARSVLPKKGGAILQIEADVQLARLLAGLHGSRARKEVSERANAVMEAGAQLLLTEDRLTATMEAAQILGLVGSARKRTLTLWQAVEFSRANDMAIESTLQIARKALEPPDDPREVEEEQELLARAKPLGHGVPQHWSSVRCACVEGVLSTAILASRHADVWDAAALLLREHWRDLPSWRQESLVKTLEAAASQMKPHQLKREGAGPPPLMNFRRAVPPPYHLQPRLITPLSHNTKAPKEETTPFIYNPSEARDKLRSREHFSKAAAQWICGETATVEIEIWNPTCQTFNVDRVTLDAEYIGDPSLAPRAQSGSASWKPWAFSMTIPPKAPPSKVQLTGIPQQKGLYNVTGCTITLNNVSWHQRWTPLPNSSGPLKIRPAIIESGGIAAARVTVAEALPLLRASMKTQYSCLSRADDSPRPLPKDRVDAPEPINIHVLKGEVLTWELSLQNAGAMRIASATLSAEQQHTGKADANLHQDRSFDLRSQPNDGNESPRSGPKPPARAPALRIHLSQDKLRKHLPLSEGAALKLPILLHGPEVAGYTYDEDAVLDFRIEYHGGQAASFVPEHVERVPRPEIVGRCYSLPAYIRFLPSLQFYSKSQVVQINSLRFLEHHEASSDGDVGLLSPKFARRRLVLEVELLNRAQVALQVWLGPKVAPAIESSAWQDVVNRPRPWQQGGSPGPAQPLTLACRIVSAHSANLVSGYADGLEAVEQESSSPNPVRGNNAGTREQRVAVQLCQRMSLYWRREDLHDQSVPMEIGALPLPAQMIEQALTLQALNMLGPAPITLAFLAIGDGDSAVGEEILVAAGQELEDDRSQDGSIWGYKLSIGQPLQMQVQMTGSIGEEVNTKLSIACHNADIGEDMQRGTEDPNVVLCGVTASVKLGSKAHNSHKFAVCFLLPGLYKVYAYDISLQSRQALPANSSSVRPSYILVK